MILGSTWEQFVNFVKTDWVLLLVIAIAIVLLIVVSILGRTKKTKAADKPAETTENTAVEEKKVEETAAVEEKDKEEQAVEEEAPVVEEVKEEATPAAEADTAIVEEAEADKKAEEVEEEKAEEQPVEEDSAKEDAAIVEAETETSDNESETKKNTRPGIVELYKGKNDFYFTFRSVHGYLIGRSQGYASKDGCKNGIKAVMKTCEEAELYDNCGKNAVADYAPQIGKAIFELYKDKAGMFRFRLFAKNQNNIASSEDYTTKASLKSAIESLKKIATNYTFVDSTLKKKAKA